MNKKIELWELFILIILLQFNYINSEIVFVYEHCRHGARGPQPRYNRSLSHNNTIYYDDFNIPWNNLEGDLTLKGKIQHYILGIRNRHKYKNLINYKKYNPEELLVHSTKRNRIKKSFYFQLLGMFNPIINISQDDPILISSISNKFYYPPNYNRWSNESNREFQNIINEAELSIKYIKKENNTNKFLEENNKYKFSLFPEGRIFYVKNKCKNYNKYMEYNYKNKYNELIKENFEKKYDQTFYNFFKYDKKEYLYDIKNSSLLIDNYIVNYYEEIDLSDFYNKTSIDKEEFYKTSLIIYEWWLYNIAIDETLCMIESSKLMADLIEYMDDKINNKNKINMVIDFGHDRTIGSIEYFMHQIFGVDYTFCNFASNLFFELHRNKNYNNGDVYYIEYYIDEVLKLNISYELFKDKVVSRNWNQKKIDDFCLGNIILILYPKFFTFLMFGIVFISVGIIILIFYKYFIKRRNPKKKCKMNIISINDEKEDNSKELDLL